MSAESAFLSQISKVKRRIVIRAVHRIALNASLIFLCISTFFFIIPKAEITNYNIYRSWYFVSIGISLSAALFIGLLTRRNLLNVFVEIDRRFKLQDRLSTAYEYLKLNKKSAFTELLIKDAAESLHQLNSKKLLPVRFSYLHAGFILLFITNVALYLMVNPATEFQARRGGQEIFENAGKLIEKYSMRRIGNKLDPKAGRQSIYAAKLGRLGNKIKDKSKTNAQRYAALDNYLKEVQGVQTRLANELGTRLSTAGIEGLTAGKIPELKNLSLNQLEKLKRLLNRTMNNRIPASINENIESLQELYSIEKLLSRIIDDFKRGTTYSAESTAPAGNESRASPYNHGLDKAYGDKNQPKREAQLLSNGRNRMDGAGQPDSGQREGDNGESQEGMGPPEGYSASAGNAESGEERKRSQEIEKSQGSRLQDKMASASTKSYLIHIRALTGIGEARLREEDIIRTYHKEVESLLQKEDIPLNYREYIKNYFISIGMGTEENANEFK
jgi:hypothetical protein